MNERKKLHSNTTRHNAHNGTLCSGARIHMSRGLRWTARLAHQLPSPRVLRMALYMASRLLIFCLKMVLPASYSASRERLRSCVAHFAKQHLSSAMPMRTPLKSGQGLDAADEGHLLCFCCSALAELEVRVLGAPPDSHCAGSKATQHEAQPPRTVSGSPGR